MGKFQWTLSEGEFLCTLLVNSHGHFCSREFLFLSEFSWTYFGLILVDTFQWCQHCWSANAGGARTGFMEHCSVSGLGQVWVRFWIRLLLDNGVTVFITINESVHENSPKISTKIHLLFPREVCHPIFSLFLDTLIPTWGQITPHTQACPPPRFLTFRRSCYYFENLQSSYPSSDDLMSNAYHSQSTGQKITTTNIQLRFAQHYPNLL